MEEKNPEKKSNSIAEKRAEKKSNDGFLSLMGDILLLGFVYVLLPGFFFLTLWFWLTFFEPGYIISFFVSLALWIPIILLVKRLKLGYLLYYAYLHFTISIIALFSMDLVAAIISFTFGILVTLSARFLSPIWVHLSNAEDLGKNDGKRLLPIGIGYLIIGASGFTVLMMSGFFKYSFSPIIIVFSLILCLSFVIGYLFINASHAIKKDPQREKKYDFLKILDRLIVQSKDGKLTTHIDESKARDASTNHIVVPIGMIIAIFFTPPELQLSYILLTITTVILCVYMYFGYLNVEKGLSRFIFLMIFISVPLNILLFSKTLALANYNISAFFIFEALYRFSLLYLVNLLSVKKKPKQNQELKESKE